MKTVYPEENGTIKINGAKLDWTMRRSKGESAFGIHASRIFELTIRKNGEVAGEYSRGWIKKIPQEDEEATLCLTYLVDRYGRSEKKKRKEE